MSLQELSTSPLNDDTKILTKTHTETFFPIPNFPKPKPKHFSKTKFSETETDTFYPRPNFLKPKPILFSDTKFSKTETKTLQKLTKVSRPRPKLRLLNIFYIFYNFWTDTQLNELLPTNNGLVHIFHILRNTNFGPQRPPLLCNIVMNFNDPPYIIWADLPKNNRI